MKQALSFIKDRIITGVIIIVPIAIVIILFKDSLKKLMDLTIPLTSKMDIGGPLSRTVMASVLIVVVLGLVFFICGLILKTYYGGRFKKWLEQSLLDHIPFFSTLNSVVHQITGVEKGNYGAVEFSQGDTDNVLLGIHTDTLPDGRFVIFAPFALSDRRAFF